MIEIGNECHCSPSYFPSFNTTVASVVQRVREVAPQVTTLSFATMAGVMIETDCTPEENRILAEVVRFWGPKGVQILPDQHIAADSFAGALRTIANLSLMVDDMRRVKAANEFRFFVGEQNCAIDKRVPNSPLCHGIGRALVHALYSNALHRMGSDTCVGVASATLYGASGHQFMWPQAGI